MSRFLAALGLLLERPAAITVRQSFIPGGPGSEGKICGYSSKAVLVDRLYEVFKQEEYDRKVRELFEDRSGPVIMIAGYQPDLSEGNWDLQNMFDNFITNADLAASRDGANLTIVKMNLNNGSYDICMNGPKLANINLECVDFSGWFEQSGVESGCDWPFAVVLWARSAIYSQAVSVSRDGVLLLGMDVVLHKNLFKWIKKHKTRRNSIMAGTAWGKMNDGYPQKDDTCHMDVWAPANNKVTCICGDVVFADLNSADFIQHWWEHNRNFLDAPFGDQDSLNDIIVNERKTYRVEIIPPKIAGMCGVPGKDATHYNCVTDKKQVMKENGHWHV